jgi:hypothetical protein
MPRDLRFVQATVLILMTGGWSLLAAAPDSSREHQIKAAFVYNVMKFVTWPESVLAAQDAVIVVAVVGSAATDFESVLATRALQGRRIVVKRYGRKGDGPPPHVLYLSADARGDAQDALRSLGGKGVLTIAETTAADVPCMVALDIENTKLVFRVNLDAVEAHELHISSSLLALAKGVESTRLKRSSS